MKRFSFRLARATLRSLGVGPMPVRLILGHMRCGSTLLFHILLTNPEFVGCGERNAPYRSEMDLDTLEFAARIAQRAPFRRHGYVVDQINHDHLTPNVELLRDERVRCIFLIRDPGPTIQSILNLTRTFYEPWSVERAVEYYCTRLDTLSQYANSLIIGGGALALTYNDLVSDTPRTLRRLESFLGIASELREEYAIQPFTGKRGDPSESIHRGRIALNPSAQPIEIPDGALDRACRAYEACSRALRLTIRSSVP